MPKKIVIVGAGLAGVSLAYALREASFDITLLDTHPSPDIDPHNPNARSIALSYGSQKILASDAWQIWEALQPYTTPIQSIHVSDRGHFGRTHLTASELKVAALGYSVQAQMLYQGLYSKLKAYSNIQIIRPISDFQIDPVSNEVRYEYANSFSTFAADLIILAEGGQSNLLNILGFERKKKDYQQTAIVSNVLMSQPHHNQAYERFTAEGPLALLPIDENKMALVWTVSPDKAETLLAKTDAEFLQDLQAAFGLRAGHFETLSQRTSHPLKLEIPTEVLKNKILLLGNAAHTLHPVAAQGFNLTLADVNSLVSYLMAEEWERALDAYLLSREKTQKQTITFTDGLINIFSNNYFPLSPLRGWALSALNNAGPLKRYVARCVMGYYE
jgi:2-octaprenyl-6-methoxyphenol hydroxylase